MKERKSKKLRQQDLDELAEETGVFPIVNKTKSQLLRETFELNPGRHFTFHELALLIPMDHVSLDSHLMSLTKANVILRAVDYLIYTLNQ